MLFSLGKTIPGITILANTDNRYYCFIGTCDTGTQPYRNSPTLSEQNPWQFQTCVVMNNCWDVAQSQRIRFAQNRAPGPVMCAQLLLGSCHCVRFTDAEITGTKLTCVDLQFTKTSCHLSSPIFPLISFWRLFSLFFSVQKSLTAISLLVDSSKIKR